MMNRPNRVNTIVVALLAGSLWGACEATIGYLLHRAHVPGLAGAVMFPLGILFMAAAFRRSGNVSVMMMTAMVAASWKGLDLLMPGGMLNIVNPVQAILLEGLAVSVVLRAVHHFGLRTSNSL
jgi:uncharacterized membrane protein (UPF0136 family)